MIITQNEGQGVCPEPSLPTSANGKLEEGQVRFRCKFLQFCGFHDVLIIELHPIDKPQKIENAIDREAISPKFQGQDISC